MARKVVVFVMGSTVVAVGVVMIFTPGPAIVVIPAGLAILATEFAWAKWLLHKLRDRAEATLKKGRELAGKPAANK